MRNRNHPLFAVLGILFAGGAALAWANEPATLGPPGGGDVHREVPDDLPLAAPLPRRTTPALPPEALSRNGVFTVQVNVDANGHNTVGDAANEPSLAIDPTNPNRMAIGWRQFWTITNNHREAGWAYSHDNGHSWTFPGVLEEGVFRSDPVLDSDASGTFFYYSLTGEFSCQLFISYDGGVSWGDPIPAFGGDKNWMTVDKVAGLGSGHIYVSWQRYYSCCAGHILARSIDGGTSFEYPVYMPSAPSFGTLAVGPNLEVYLAGIEASGGQNFSQFVVSKSVNAHLPDELPVFTTVPVDLGGSMGHAQPPNPAGLMGQAQVAVDHSGGPTHGYVYLLCSVDPPGSDPMDVYLARSTDGGVTWDPPVRVNDDPVGTDAWQWFGTISVAPNGRIDVVWNDTRTSGEANINELYYSYSTDGAVTWSANVPVSPPFDSFQGFPNQNKLGDYYHMVSDDVGASLAWAATFNVGPGTPAYHDYEQDIYFTRIGDFDCNGNGIGDDDDLIAGTVTDLNSNGIPDQCERLGDVDCDGEVDFGDINPFVLALVDYDLYLQLYPECPLKNRDISGDGVFDFGDINPFVALMLTLQGP